MKVALFGNMNNILFSMARYLRDRGVDAHLFLFDDESSHFHPSADTFDLKFQAYTTQLPWGHALKVASTKPLEIARVAGGFDRLIGCGTAPAYLDKIGRGLDIFVPYGGDVFELPFRLQHLSRLQPRASAESLLRQRRGIRRARTILVDGSVAYEQALNRLSARGQRLRVALPFPHVPTYAPDVLAHNHVRGQWYPDLKALRERSDVMVFHHARHIWGDAYGHAQAKGNDKLIRGFAKAHRLRPDARLSLVMCEYGPEVARSRALVGQLGLDAHVLWLPQTQRKELMLALSLADIGCGEFSVSWLSGGTIYETLTAGKPLLHHRDDALYARDFPELYPMMHANTSEQVCEHLVRYIDNPAPFLAMGEAGRQWHMKYAVEQPMRAVMDLL